MPTKADPALLSEIVFVALLLSHDGTSPSDDNINCSLITRWAEYRFLPPKFVSKLY